MVLCDKHWQKLRQNIETFGLRHLVAHDAETLHTMLTAGGHGLNYDPLIGATLTLTHVAHLYTGIQDGCPACVLENFDWCEGAALQSLRYCEAHGLLVPLEEK